MYIIHTDDTVYLSEEVDREEYIMNESGIIWAGAHNDMFTWPWNFAQVSSYILSLWYESCLGWYRSNPLRV